VRSRIAGVVAATLLSVGAGRVMAGETQFQAPDTGRASASHVGLDRTAFIGAGHAATSAPSAGASLGSPASPHWSASIGTGHVSGESVQGSETVAHGLALEAPVLHWTSKIGTGHAEDSSKGLPNGGVRLTASK
jgi:hypothetical protein